MGTTVEKFNYAFGTKDLLKTEINKINNVLDDNSTFRSYPQELFNGYLDILNNGTDTLWNNLEKVSQTGTEVVLENVETAPIKMVLSGNTSQETTSGKNLQAPLSSSTTMNGVTFTPIFEDGMLQYVNVNGTSTSVAYVDLPDINFSAGTYVMTGSPSGGSDSNYQQRFVTGTSNLGTDNGNGVSVTLNEATSCHVRIRIASGYTANNLKFYPMVRLSSVTDATYEPYTNGASPSPDYPQEVKVVKGENVVSVQGKNLFDISQKINTNIKEDGTEIVSSGINNSSNYIEVEEGQSYVYSFDLDYSVAILRIHGYNAGKEWVEQLWGGTIGTGNKHSYQITIPTGKKYVRFTFRVANPEETNIQFEQGSTATPYVPYSKTDYPINLGDIELCKINTYKDYFHKDSGKWYVHKAIGKKILDGSERWATQASWNYENTSVYHSGIQNATNSSVLISNYFTYNAISYSKDINGIMQIVWGTNLLLRINNSIAPTVEDFKTWLSTHNTIVYYVLATPTETEITNTTLIEQLEAISNAKSVKDKTYITQTNEELPFILDVEAIKEYEVN